MKKNNLPLRQCVACKSFKPKSELIRIVKIKDSNEFIYDKTGKMNGRGAYICNSKECIDLAINKKLINRSFKQNISDDIYDKIKENFNC